MTAKTGSQILSDVYQMLRNSSLPTLISGEVYRKGYRPRDSKAEDATVAFTAGLPGEVQTGIVTVNIYVPDIDPFSNGVLVENGQRCAALEQAAAEWVKSLTADKSNYKFELQQTIYTEADAAINQHFIVVKLKYQLFE